MKIKDRKKLRHSVLTKRGGEIPNPMPISMRIPKRYRKRSVESRIREVVEEMISNRFAEHGYETEQEANDFETDEDIEFEDNPTRYTLMEEEVPLSEVGLTTPEEDNPSGSEGSEPPKGGDPVVDSPPKPTADPSDGSE